MKLVINPTKCTATSITASNKIAIWISKLLNIKLVDDKELAKKYLDFPLEKVFIINGMFGFCDFRDEIKKICEKADEVIWIGNDYAIKLPSNLSFLKTSNKLRRIAQYSNFDGFARHDYVDFNKLLHWQGEKQDYQYEGLFYYGAFREDRRQSFKHWLSQSKVDVHVSTSIKNFPDFARINKKMKLYKAGGDIRRILGKFQSSIYIEDEFSHKNLMSPANRFYEVIGSKSLLFYDIKCKKTLDNSGLWNDLFAVASIDDISRKLLDYEMLRDKQIEMFKDRDFKQELTDDFLRVI